MEEISVIIIISSTILLIFCIFLFSIMLLYNKRRMEYTRELSAQKELFQEELMKTQLEIQEQTLRNVSQEIHDNIGQTLSLVKLNLNTIDTVGRDSIDEKIHSSKELVGKAIHDLRNLSRSLSTDSFLSGGLWQAIRGELALIGNTGFETVLNVPATEITIDTKKELILFRIVQEAINNIIKHADAHSIEIEAVCAGHSLTLTIRDNGKGFDPAAASEGSGLRNMRSRAQLIGGSLDTESGPAGTTIKVTIPISGK